MELMDVHDQKFEDHTALSLLFAKINYDKHEKGFACIQVLLENHAEINVTDKDLISPIAHILLEWLLAIIPKENDKLVNEDPLLSQLVKRMGLNIDKTKCPYFKCMTILLKDARIELDKLDHTNSTALHYAVQYKIEHAQELLLKNGAYIGAQNIFNELPITNMDPDLLEKHLDTCISNNRRIPGDEDYGVIIDYKNFIPPTLKTTDTEQQDTCKNEMRPINDIAQSPSLKRLLRHPVISSILLLKWQKLSWVFYTQLFTSLWLCNMLASQDHLSKCECKSFENFIKLLLIIAFGTVLLHELDEEWWRGLSSFVILLAAIEVLFLTGTLPVLSLSTYMTIMAKVSKNYLKCLMLYSTILLAFALSFYTLFHEKDRTQSEGSRSENATSATSQDANNQIKWFGNLPLAFFKTAVMSFGELEASNMHFQYSIVSYIVFAVFIFIVPMVLFNLMNGLAVNDTTEIRSEAEIITMTQRAFYIYKKEIAARTFRSFRCL
ncbi:transient receptor potential cation channel protein painless-like [Anopheles nili]|uniref:transient receptor potential cation channel protein painless-like n=1 Tax=Anopheles nili TaxID=185578 RepID=UPI00237B4A26|nr:transient receptor potential cation channel protein painless-like [Anopheles nili]